MTRIQTAILGAAVALGVVAVPVTVFSAATTASAAERSFSQQQVGRSSGAFKAQGTGQTKARECTWTNENKAECSEWKGDTIVFTCFDKYGKSIGC